MEQRWSKREPVFATVGRMESAGSPLPIGVQFSPPRAPDARQGTLGFGICSAGFCSYFGRIFPGGNPIPLFWNENDYFVHCVLGQITLFFFTIIYFNYT